MASFVKCNKIKYQKSTISLKALVTRIAYIVSAIYAI